MPACAGMTRMSITIKIFTGEVVRAGSSESRQNRQRLGMIFPTKQNKNYPGCRNDKSNRVEEPAQFCERKIIGAQAIIEMIGSQTAQLRQAEGLSFCFFSFSFFTLWNGPQQRCTIRVLAYRPGELEKCEHENDRQDNDFKFPKRLRSFLGQGNILE